MNLAEAIARQARHRPHRTAIVQGERLVSFGELQRIVLAVAAHLARAGAGEGTRLAVSMGNTPEHVAAMLAIARIGAVAVAANPTASEELRAGIAARYRAALLVREPSARPIAGLAEVVVAAGGGDAAGLPVPAAAPGGAAPWRIALSSGTTGVPRGTAWSHRRTLAQFLFQLSSERNSTGQRYLIPLDLNIAFALHATLRLLLDGATVVMADDADPAAIVRLVDRHGVDHLRTSPAVISRLLEALPRGSGHLERLQSLTLGGSPVSQELMQRIRTRLTPRVTLDYGATEFGGVARCDPLLHARHPEAAGRLQPWVEVRIEDEDGQALPAGSVGRVGLRALGEGPEGYVDDPEATARAYRDGWFYPGDLGSLTEGGVLLLAGRSDDVVSLGGVKINLSEVDLALQSHPDVVEGAGFVVQSPRGTTVLVAAVVAAPGLDEAALRRHCAQRLRGQAPAHVLKVAALPRNAAGKVVRRELARRVRVAPASPASGAA
ncbi:MAG: class I adenylate-forming enzyme family protein [Gammaproteobacteria bacterium]